MKKTILFLSLSLCCSAYSFNMNPISNTIYVDEKTSQTYTLENPTSEPIAVEFSFKTRSMTSSGGETNSDINGELSVYPQMLKIAPGTKKIIRVSWRGPKNLSSEQSYRFIAEQLPLSFEKNDQGNGVKMLIKYESSLYISKSSFDSDFKILKFNTHKKRLNLSIENKGLAHKIFANERIAIVTPKKTVYLKGGDLKGIRGENILPGVTREFSIALPKDIDSSKIQDVFITK